IFTVPAASGNTLGFNVVVTDSSSAKANSVNYQTLTVTGALAVTVYTSPALPTTLGIGDLVPVNAYATGGSGTYTTYNFLVFNTVTNIVVANYLTTVNGFIFTVPAASGNTLGFNVVVTDSSSAKANSVNYQTLTVTGALAVTVFTNPALPTTLGIGDLVPVNAYATGGSGTYTTYNFLVFNTVTNIVVANYLTTVNGFIFTVPAASGNTLGFNVVVTDSSSAKANSVNYQTLTVTGALAVTVFTNPALPTTLGIGDLVPVNAYATGGSGTYTTYNFLVFNTVTNIVVANYLTT